MLVAPATIKEAHARQDRFSHAEDHSGGRHGTLGGRRQLAALDSPHRRVQPPADAAVSLRRVSTGNRGRDLGSFT